MSEFPHVYAPAAEATDPPRGTVVSRRTMVSAAAWSVPAVALMASSPALANSTPTGVSVVGPTGGIPGDGSGLVTVSVRDSSGAAQVGVPVSLTGPSGSSFDNASGVTDGAGTFTATMTLGDRWASPGSTVTVSAVSGSQNASAAVTVLGANALVAGANVWGALGDGGATGNRDQESFVQLQRVFPSPIKQIATSGWNKFADHQASFALLNDGTVWAVGDGAVGLLGQGDYASSSTWVKVPGLSDVTQIATGESSAYALTSSGDVYAWGENNRYQAGHPSAWMINTPAKMAGLSNVTKISAAWETPFALQSDGTLKSWGLSGDGILGNGTTTPGPRPRTDRSQYDLATPTTVQTSGPVADFAPGIAILTSGDVQTWGDNTNGQLANGTTSTTPVLTPTTVSFPGTIKKVLIGGDGFVLALLTDGTVMSWGRNNSGQLGNGSSGTAQPTPTAISGLTNVVDIATGMRTGYVLKSDGTVWSWGDDGYGQLGVGYKAAGAAYLTPQKVTNLSGRTVTRLMTVSTYAPRVFVVCQ